MRAHSPVCSITSPNCMYQLLGPLPFGMWHNRAGWWFNIIIKYSTFSGILMGFYKFLKTSENIFSNIMTVIEANFNINTYTTVISTQTGLIRIVCYNSIWMRFWNIVWGKTFRSSTHFKHREKNIPFCEAWKTSVQPLHVQMNMNTVIHHLLQAWQPPDDCLPSLRPNICRPISFLSPFSSFILYVYIWSYADVHVPVRACTL